MDTRLGSREAEEDVDLIALHSYRVAESSLPQRARAGTFRPFGGALAAMSDLPAAEADSNGPSQQQYGARAPVTRIVNSAAATVTLRRRVGVGVRGRGVTTSGSARARTSAPPEALGPGKSLFSCCAPDTATTCPRSPRAGPFGWIGIHHPYLVRRISRQVSSSGAVINAPPNSPLITRALRLVRGAFHKDYRDPRSESQRAAAR
jgi:hypothetical protein